MVPVKKMPPQIKDCLAGSRDTTMLHSFAVDGLQPTAYMGPVGAVLVAELVLQRAFLRDDDDPVKQRDDDGQE